MPQDFCHFYGAVHLEFLLTNVKTRHNTPSRRVKCRFCCHELSVLLIAEALVRPIRRKYDVMPLPNESRAKPVRVIFEFPIKPDEAVFQS